MMLDYGIDGRERERERERGRAGPGKRKGGVNTKETSWCMDNTL
jgi:hypothetical protein